MNVKDYIMMAGLRNTVKSGVRVCEKLRLVEQAIFLLRAPQYTK
jgi:hypothetical protein